MGYASWKKVSGILTMGGEVPHLDPNKALIVGIDIPETADNWFAHCPRVHDETDADLEPLVQFIMSGGKTDPVDVYRDGDTMVILDGRRTTRATRIAWSRQAQAKVPVDERVSIRVMTQKGTPEELYRVNALSHNQKPLTAIQRAKLFLTYYNRVGEDTNKVAAFFNVTTQTVRNNLALFDLAEPVQKMLEKGEIPMREAVKLTGMPREQQVAAADELKQAGATSGAAVANGIAKIKRGEKLEGKADKSRLRPKPFLESFHAELKKIDGYESLAGWFQFVLGGPPPKDTSPFLLEMLEKCGYKAPKEKKVKEPKAPKEKKVKEPKAAKTVRAKKAK